MISHRLGRALSLVLAVLFLLLSGAVAFSAAFTGIPVLADEPAETAAESPPAETATSSDADHPSVTKIMAAVVDGDAVNINLLKTELEDGVLIKKLHITIEHELKPVDPPFPAPKEGDLVNFTFKNKLLTRNPGGTAKILNVTADTTNNSVSYIIELTDVIYQAQSYDTLSFTYEYTNTNNTQTTIPEIKVTLYSARTEGSMNMTYAEFWRGNSAISKVVRGRYSYFNVTIRENGMDKDDLNALIAQNAYTISINDDFIRYSENSGNPAIKDVANRTDGVEYVLSFKNPEYTGISDTMMLTIDYDGPDQGLTPRKLKDQIPGCEIYQRESSKDDDEDESSSSRPDIAPPTPNIIVSKFDFGGQNVQAASPFTLNVVLTNTSKKLPIDNIVMKVTVPEALTMNNSSNTFYIDHLTRNSSIERTLEFAVKPNAEPISHPIKLSFSFEAVIDETRKQFTSEEEISIPVSQLDRFSLSTIEVPEQIFVGEDMGIEVSFVNKGKTPVYNVTAEITGNISQPGQRQFIGNIESGKEESADFMIGALEPGEISGEVLITYEDANMHIGELRSPFTTLAMSMDVGPDIGAMNPEEMLPEPPPAVKWYEVIPVWGYLVVATVIVILFAFTAKVVRARRDQKLLEEDDEDF